MNANELTEIIEKNKPEIEKVNAYIKSLEDEIAALKATPQIKELSKDEIIEIRQEVWDDNKFISEIFFDFARAILKKAGEK